MTEQYKTTFNYLLTHHVTPNVLFANKEIFYEKIITDPANLQSFMQEMVDKTAAMAKDNPDIEPAYKIENFQMRIAGDSVEKAVIVVDIPNCEKDCDCIQIAFTCGGGHSRYFTCELSTNPMTNEQYFLTGEWEPKEDGLKHLNYGELDRSCDDPFATAAIKIAYGKNADDKEMTEQ